LLVLQRSLLSRLTLPCTLRPRSDLPAHMKSLEQDEPFGIVQSVQLMLSTWPTLVEKQGSQLAADTHCALLSIQIYMPIVYYLCKNVDHLVCVQLYNALAIVYDDSLIEP
jgi:hypothetical protein